MVQENVLNIIILKETNNKWTKKEKVTHINSKNTMVTIKITKKRLLTLTRTNQK